MYMAAIALYSSSPPAAVLSSFHNSSTAHFDYDSNSRPAHQPHHHHRNSTAAPVLGGLSGLFKSSNRSPLSVCDGLDLPIACTSGMVHSSSYDNLSYRDCSTDSRGGGSMSIPNGTSSFMFRNGQSPVSVLHGPVTRSSPGSTSGLPPLERHSRRRDLVPSDNRSLSSSGSFDVWSDGSSLLVGSHSRVSLSADSSTTSSSSTSPGVDHNENLSQYFMRKDGSALPAEGLLNDISAEPKELQEARRRLTRLAQGIPGTKATSRTSNLPLTADELLIDAQERHKMFFHPLVIKAFGIAEEAHRGQVRRSGGLYLVHCVETAIVLANTGADSTVVAAGLLHDTLDDSTLDQARLRVLVGDEIEILVSGVSKLSTFSQLARDNETAANPEEADRLRTMFLAMVDVRVVLIKLADRLHNLRTLEALPKVKRLRIAQETMEILAPLANKLGIWSWKAEMEDICFRHLKPQEHAELASKMSDGWKEGVVMSSIQQLESALRAEGVEFTDICGRPKNLYSIYSKMIRKGRTVDEIFDVRGLRLIVKDRRSCYAALEVVHRLWSHVPRKFKDYIASPKTNGYQSLHTVIWGEDGHPLELQIRTTGMHHQAEYGMAAHWRYKESNSKHSSFVLQKVEWARWVLTWHSEILDTKLRVSPLRADLKPPCPFPFHQEDCPNADSCSLPPYNEDDPLFVIMLKNNNMTVQELAPGSTAADLLIESSSDRDSVAASRRRTSRKLRKPKVNHRFVDNFQQRLRMGDIVELTSEPEEVPVMVPLSNRKSELTQAQICSLLPEDKPCGKIALEFQREQLKRLYRDGASNKDTKTGPPSPEETNASVASLS